MAFQLTHSIYFGSSCVQIFAEFIDFFFVNFFFIQLNS